MTDYQRRDIAMPAFGKARPRVMRTATPSTRYRQIGNAVAVPLAEWLGADWKRRRRAPR